MKSKIGKFEAVGFPRQFVTLVVVIWAMATAMGNATAHGQHDQGAEWPSTSADEHSHVQRADFQSLPVRTADHRHDAADVSSLDPPAPSDDVLAGIDSSEPPAGWWTPIRSNLRKIDLPRMAGSLAIVLGLYLGFVWLTKTFGSRANRAVPREVVDVLGYAPVGPKQRMQVIRLGSKLLLVVQSESGMQTVGEITDPDEADYLAALCQGKPTSRWQRQTRTAPRGDTARSSNLRTILNQLEHALTSDSSRTQFDA